METPTCPGAGEPERAGFVESAGVRIHLVEWGDRAAEPVVLCHGMWDHARSFALLAPRLPAPTKGKRCAACSNRRARIAAEASWRISGSTDGRDKTYARLRMGVPIGGALAPSRRRRHSRSKAVARLFVLTAGALLSLSVGGVPALAGTFCIGDCDGDGAVTPAELVTSVDIALGRRMVDACDAIDSNGDSRASVDELVVAVGQALSACGANPLPTATDTRTPPAPTATPSPTVTPTPTRSASPSAGLTVSGTCGRPGGAGIVACSAGTRIFVSRCDDRSTCLEDAAARTPLGEGSVGAAGAFSVTVDAGEARLGALHMEAELEDAVVYRTLDFGSLGAGSNAAAPNARGLRPPVARQSLPGTGGEVLAGVTIDPSSEGAVQVLNIAGLGQVGDNDATALIEQTRGESGGGSIFAGQSAAAAALTATEIAFDLFFVSFDAFAASPDGTSVYGTSIGDAAVAVFRRDAAGGPLRFVEVQRDGVAGVDGLGGASGVAVSPDGAHVYVAGRFEDSVVVFARDEETGILRFVQQVRDGVDGVRGLGFATGVAVSGNGRNVYVATFGGDSVVVFDRDPVSGELDFIERQRNGVGGVAGLDSAELVAVSPDGANVYAGSELGDTLAVFRRDTTTGRLTFVEVHQDGVNGVSGIDALSSFAISSDGAHLYAVGRNRAVARFARDPASGELTFLGALRDEDLESGALFGAETIALSPDGAHAYVGGSGRMAAFERDAQSGALEFLELQRDAFREVIEFEDSTFTRTAFVRALVVTPDGGQVIATGVSAAAVFDRDAPSGSVTFAENARAFFVRRVGLKRPEELAMSPDGAHLYVTSPNDDSVAVFGRDAASGMLTFVEVQRNGVSGVQGIEFPEGLAMSPDGAYVYVLGDRGDLEPFPDVAAIAVFARNPATGGLRFLAAPADETSPASSSRNFALAGDGAYVYVTSFGGDAIGAFSRDAESGLLEFRGSREGVERPGPLTSSPDGRHVYVATASDSLTVFARDETGALDPVQVLTDGVDGVDGVAFARDLAVSPDGAHLYVVAGLGGSATVFARNPASGRLDFVGVEPSVAGLQGATSVTVSPEGAHVYIACRTEDAVAVFARAAGAGTLRFVEVQRDGQGGVQDLGAPDDVLVSPDGAHVYVASAGDDALVVFARDRMSGALSFVEIVR